MEYFEKPERAELIDLAAVMQDRILDLQWPWIEGLPVTREIKREVFVHLCVATGMLLDATMDPGKFNKLMELDH